MFSFKYDFLNVGLCQFDALWCCGVKEKHAPFPAIYSVSASSVFQYYTHVCVIFRPD